MMILYLGHSDAERETQEVARNARLARVCEKWGLVLIIEVQSARIGTHSEDLRDPALLSLGCRIAAEIGADIVKCEYPRNPEDFADIVSSCPVPIILAGGAKIDETEKALEMARNAMVTGAAGLAFGRHIFQSDNPTETIAKLLNIVHGEQ